jgi:hypothetical protein
MQALSLPPDSSVKRTERRRYVSLSGDSPYEKVMLDDEYEWFHPFSFLAERRV